MLWKKQINPHKGRSSMKQFIKGTPHKWGFKATRAGSSGVMKFEIYTGAGTCDDFGLGFSGDIVFHLCKTIPSNKNHKIFNDIYFFSSISLAVLSPFASEGSSWWGP